MAEGHVACLYIPILVAHSIVDLRDIQVVSWDSTLASNGLINKSDES